jgi:GTP cyclohydrolase II
MHVPIVREIRPLTTWRASADLPTKHGMFKMHVFVEQIPNHGAREHIAMVFGDVRDQRAVPVRVHSECITSEVFGSLKCDCREQLEAAVQAQCSTCVRKVAESASLTKYARTICSRVVTIPWTLTGCLVCPTTVATTAVPKSCSTIWASRASNSLPTIPIRWKN